MLGLGLADIARRGDAEAFPILDRARQLGCTLWDIEEHDAGAHLLARYFASRPGVRETVFIVAHSGRLERPQMPHASDPYDQIMYACSNSLRRTGEEYIDLYIVTVPERPFQTADNVLRAVTDLLSDGRIRHIGLNDPSPDTLRRMHVVHPVHAVSVEYSPFSVPDQSLRRTCGDLGIVLLGRDHKVPKGTGIDDRVLAIAKTLEGVARGHYSVNAVQIGLAWLFAQADDVVPMPRTKTIHDLEAHVRATRIPLSVFELRELAHTIRTLPVMLNSSSTSSSPMSSAPPSPTTKQRWRSSGSSAESTLADESPTHPNKRQSLWGNLRSALDLHGSDPPQNPQHNHKYHYRLSRQTPLVQPSVQRMLLE